MKNFKILAAAFMLMTLPMLLTSCDDDPYYDDYWYNHYTWGHDYDDRPDDENISNEDFFVQMAQTLKGQWRGDMMAYALDEQGNVVDSVYYLTDIEFTPYNDNSITGTGTQYDYDGATGQQLLMQRNFSWYIETTTGNIYLTYKESNADGTTSDYMMRIKYDDLNLNEREFTGYLWANDGKEVDDFLFERYYSNGAKATTTRATKTAKVKKIKFVMK